MSRVAVKIELSLEETDELNKWLKSGKTEQRKVERAKIVLRSAEGKTTIQVARELGTRPSRVSKWRTRFAKLRLPGLEDEQRSGRKVINDESVERRILDQLTKACSVARYSRRFSNNGDRLRERKTWKRI
jgi:hypothetical protein